jgi:subtilisin family serine protease
MVVRVAVIDSGWDRSIPDDRVLPGVGLSGEGADGVACSTDDHDRIGHGTMCADIVLQIAPSVEIIPYRIFGDTLETSPGILLAAIDRAVQDGAQLISLSVATSRADAALALYRACANAATAGTLMVSAVDNGTGAGYPACFDLVIGVGVDPSRRHGDPLEVERGRGKFAEYMLPDVPRRARGLGGGVVEARGTSSGAPVVTGILAGILHHEPALTISDARARLNEICPRRSPRDAVRNGKVSP